MNRDIAQSPYETFVDAMMHSIDFQCIANTARRCNHPNTKAVDQVQALSDMWLSVAEIFQCK